MIVYIDISSCVKEKQHVTKCLFGFSCFALCCGANASVMNIKKISIKRVAMLFAHTQSIIIDTWKHVCRLVLESTVNNAQ